MTVLEVIRDEISDTGTPPSYSDERLVRYMNMAGEKVGEVTETTLVFTNTTPEGDITLNELEAVIMFVQYKICMDKAEVNAKGISYDEGVYKVDKKGVGKTQVETCNLILNNFKDLLGTIAPTQCAIQQGSLYYVNH